MPYAGEEATLLRQRSTIGYHTEGIHLQAVDVAVEMNRNRDLGIPVPDYVDENVSDKVVKIIQSYTGVVNKMVWRKY